MTPNHSVELLAPAGDFETALAAFAAGADAVYCGLADFSARAFAKNFSFEELERLIAYAHAHDGKVYVTFNTVLDEDQLDGAIETLAKLEDVGPDGVIVQDLGVAELIRTHFPGLQLHASTQLVAHNLEGVLALKEFGFTRVVLARELSAEEIASIAKRCGDLELEVFIHGALCYSLSGLCLFGAMEKGRSGNRGKCPYCCRMGYKGQMGAERTPRGDASGVRGAPALPEGVSGAHAGPGSDGFDVSTGRERNLGRVYPFSMKDLRVGDDVVQLVNAGVVSLKIEGRMKSALYVASVTKYYRQILGADHAGAVARKVTVGDLETVFSRKTTELYLKGADASSASPIDPEALGHLGALVGIVKRVTRDREGRAWLRFHTSRGLEKHDGLQFEATDENGKHLGMGIVEMRPAISRHLVFEVSAGTDVEIRVDEEIESRLRPGMKIYCSMSNAVRRMFPQPSYRPSDYEGGRVLDLSVRVEASGVTATEKGGTEARIDCALEAAKNPEKTPEAIRKSFAKLGGTGYRLGELAVDDPEKRFVPMSVLNDLRRDLVEKMDETRASAIEGKIEEAKNDGDEMTLRDRKASERIKIRVGQPIPAGEWDEVIVAITSETEPEELPNACQAACAVRPPCRDTTSKLRLALPVYTSELVFNRLRSAVKRLIRAGYVRWEASDLATLRMLRELGVTDITADWTLYAFNSHALKALSAMGVRRFVASPENGRQNLQYLAESGYDVEFIRQQSTPLFVSLTEPATQNPDENLRVFNRDGLWVTTRPAPRTFDLPEGVSKRIDLSWDVTEGAKIW